MSFQLKASDFIHLLDKYGVSYRWASPEAARQSGESAKEDWKNLVTLHPTVMGKGKNKAQLSLTAIRANKPFGAKRLVPSVRAWLLRQMNDIRKKEDVTDDQVILAAYNITLYGGSKNVPVEDGLASF